MSWIDRSVRTEPRLLDMLGPGERLLATASVGPAMAGVERIIEPPPPPPPHKPASGVERVALGAAFVAVAALAPTGWSGGDLLVGEIPAARGIPEGQPGGGPP